MAAMRITRIGATGLLSFAGAGARDEAFSIDPGDATVFIGPNGAGKSNLAALVHLVGSVVAAERRPAGANRAATGRVTALDRAGVLLRHRGIPDGEAAEVRLGLELTTLVEIRLVRAFLRAALVSQLTTNNPNNKAEFYWPLVDELPDGAFDPFLRGELVVSHSGVAGSQWRARFEPSNWLGPSRLVWDLSMNAGQLVQAEATEPSQEGDLWAKMGLPGGRTGTGDPPQESFDPAAFSFAGLVKGPEDRWATVIALTGLMPEQLAPAVRRFLAQAGVSVSLGARTSIGAAYVWDELLRRGLRIVDTDAPLGLRDEVGLLAGSWRYSADELAQPASLSSRDLPRRLWESYNGGPEGAERLARVNAHFAAIAPGKQLYVAGNLVIEAPEAGSSTAMNLVISDLPQGMGMLGQGAPVLAVPTAGGQPERPGRVSLEVELLIKSAASRPEPLMAAGSGVAQALVIAEALGDARGRATFLDEPATNLHPGWQRLVRQQVDQLAATNVDEPSEVAQFLVITHSASLAAPTRVPGVNSVLPTRLILEDGATRAVGPPEPTGTVRWPADLRLSPETWGLLFAQAVLLTEGPTEVGALPIWFDKISRDDGDFPWNARNISVFSVGGQTAFGSWASFLCHYRVPFAICCDGQVLDPCVPVKDHGSVVGFAPNSQWIFKQVADAKKVQLNEEISALRPQGERWEQHPDRPTFQEVVAIAGGLGIFTLSTWFQKSNAVPPPASAVSTWESIDDMIDQDPVLQAAKSSTGAEPMSRSDVRLGAYLAAQCDAPAPVRQLYRQVRTWLSLVD
jgi:predicted ATPase